MVVYWMMILIPDKCVNSGLLNDDILIKQMCQSDTWWYFD